MSKLEKKILKKVYSFETKQTLSQLILRLLLMVSLTTIAILFVTIVMDELREQQTLDMLEIFNENYVIIKENIMEVLTTFFQELPMIETLFIALIVFIFLVLFLKFILNFTKIKNKIQAIIKYWFAS